MMGLLDYADSARKKLAGLLGDMPLVQMAQGRAEMPTMAGLLGALKGMPVFSPDAGQSAYEAALNIGPMGLGKIVYHGSPHKFDKFDASKIGTGEGAQAYGHGVYMADSPDVARQYKADRSYVGKAMAGTPVANDWGPDWIAKNAIDIHGENAADHLRNVLEQNKNLKAPGQAASNADVAAAIDLISSGKVSPSGSLYKADLPDEWIPKMLDWDKPLKELPQIVQQNVYNKLTDIGIDKGVVNHILNNKTGQELMNELAGRMSVRNPSPLPGSAQASQLLREAGIPGIRYLDGGSRPNSGRISMLEQTIANLQGKGASKAAIANAQRELDAELARASYNYVVFPGLEDQVKILERNGVPLSGLLGGN